MASTIGKARPNILVLGGGFAGLEAAFLLRKRLRDRAAISLVSDQTHFLFRPNTIYIPFGLDPERLKLPLATPLGKKHVGFVHARAREIDPYAKRVAVEPIEPVEGGGALALRYDYLVVATGAGMRAAEVPGLAEHAHTVWTPSEMLRLRAAFERLLGGGSSGSSGSSGAGGAGGAVGAGRVEGKPARRRQVLFVVPPNNKHAGPLYELVQMLDTWLRRKGARDTVDLTWTTYEAGYLQALGPRLHQVIKAEFDRRAIRGYTGYVVDRIEPGQAHFTHGGTHPYDLLVSFPPYVAAMPFPGLPADERGFLATHLETRQVVGHPEIYAAGDAADFPIKLASLALLQADAAAEQIAADVLGGAPGAAFEPTGRYVMEQLDTATYAQVPLRLTGLPQRPVEVDPAQWAQYKVGSSLLWGMGKRALGSFVPARFGAGEPFEAGLPWKGMEVGRKAMATVLAAPVPRPPAPVTAPPRVPDRGSAAAHKAPGG